MRHRAAKRAAAVAAVIVSVLLIGGAVAAYAFVQGLEREMQDEVKVDESVGEALTEKAPEEPFNILLLGSDARPEEEAARADTIIVARVDPGAKRIWMLSIPRDTRVEIPDNGVNKINAANYLGGPALMIDTVEEFLGMPIHHYMEVDFNGFQGIVDAMGGIYVNVEQEIDDWRAASHSPSNRAKHIEPGYQLLDGEHALTFVRSRDFPDADFTRMKHQQEFFKALASQSMRWSNVLKLPGMAREFARNVSTDMGVGQILSIAQGLRGIDSTNVQTATLPGEWRSPYIVPDVEMKEYLVGQVLSDGDIEERPDEEALLSPADVSVAIRNGGGIAGSAAMAAERLRARGFDIREVGNANQFVYEETLVVYTDNEEAARLVARQLKTDRLVPSRGMYSFDADILVVVGADWAALVGSDGGEQ
jgi:polyisoprenyl-teichoic acid--peptidoglycan teichoic acid transferase